MRNLLFRWIFFLIAFLEGDRGGSIGIGRKKHRYMKSE